MAVNILYADGNEVNFHSNFTEREKPQLIVEQHERAIERIL